MSLEALSQALEALPFAVAIKQSTWIFPTLEALHVLAIGLVVGSIAMVDLRLINVAWRERDLAEIIGEVLPWTWTGFVFAVLTGLLMFCSRASHYLDNLPFQVKMGLLLLAGVNMGCFHFLTWQRTQRADRSAGVVAATRAAGTISLSVWVGIVAFGRWIGFT